MNYLPWIISIVVGLVVWLVFYTLFKKSQKVYAELTKYKERASKAANANELMQIYGQLHEFHEEKCWHRQHSAYANEIVSYIAGRLNNF